MIGPRSGEQCGVKQWQTASDRQGKQGEQENTDTDLSTAKRITILQFTYTSPYNHKILYS